MPATEVYATCPLRSVQSAVCLSILLVGFVVAPSLRAAELVNPVPMTQQRGTQFHISGRAEADGLPATAAQITFVFQFQLWDGAEWKDSPAHGKVTVGTSATGPNRVKMDTPFLEFAPEPGQQWRIHVRGHYKDGDGKHELPAVTSRPVIPRR